MSNLRRRARAESEQDFELNITSIIDCFTVLIAFILTSASFISIGILDTEIAAAGATQIETSKPEVTVLIEVRGDQSIQVSLSGKETRSHLISAMAGSPDYNQLSDRLALVKGQWPALKEATLMADAKVSYKSVVKSMEVAKKAFPSVLLGGF